MNVSRQAVSRRRFGRLLAAAAGSALLLPICVRASEDVLHRALADSVGLARRFRWARTPPRRSRLRAAGDFSRITVHHEGGSVNRHRSAADVAADLRHIWAGHTRRGYGDIGYHFLVDYAGRLWEGRPLIYEGAHVAGHNPGNLGIALLGNFEEQRPTPQQLSTLTGVLTLLAERLQLAPSRICAHRDLADTLCPGRYLYPHVQDLRSSYAALAARRG
jgi:hypothetical protein